MSRVLVRGGSLWYCWFAFSDVNFHPMSKLRREQSVLRCSQLSLCEWWLGVKRDCLTFLAVYVRNLTSAARSWGKWEILVTCPSSELPYWRRLFFFFFKLKKFKYFFLGCSHSNKSASDFYQFLKWGPLKSLEKHERLVSLKCFSVPKESFYFLPLFFTSA